MLSPVCYLLMSCPRTSWEANDAGRAERASLLWTQRQAAKVANTSDDFARDPLCINACEGGDEEWVKARAAALNVPLDLEKARQARCIHGVNGLLLYRGIVKYGGAATAHRCCEGLLVNRAP